MAIMRHVRLMISLMFCFFLNGHLMFSTDRIFANQSLSGDQKIISAGGNFRLGFFQSGISSYSSKFNYYLGISYYKLDEVASNVIWVANRENPISDTKSAMLKMVDGNLVILNELQEQVWSTNIVINSTNLSGNLVAILVNDGNLVLTDDSNLDTKAPFWQSFDYPGNVWMPGAKISFNNQTNTNQILTSWTSLEDPAPGPYTLELDPNGSQLIMRWKMSQLYWTSGSWGGHMLNLVLESNINLGYVNVFNFSYVDNENESYFTYSLDNPVYMSMLKMDPYGQFNQYIWTKESKGWFALYSQPRERCEVYGFCGSFSICDPQASNSICQCLNDFNGFDPSDNGHGIHFAHDRPWCQRYYPQQCLDSTIHNGEREQFEQIPHKFLSEQSSVSPAVSIAECESTCLTNCLCIAYTFDNGSCSIWNGELLNLRRLFPGENGSTIYIRRKASRFTDNGWMRKKKMPVIGPVLGSISMMLVFLGILLFVVSRRQKQMTTRATVVKDLLTAFLYRYLQIAKQRVSDKLREGVFGLVFQVSLTQSTDFQAEFSEIPVFTFEMIQAATDEFSAANKLGEGGYGPVYKGKLPNGQDIAVKRLSRTSDQGVQEFKNEVALISKVQHWNLVKLLGYCIRGEDRMLVYEYMPNKSLDAFIFGSVSLVLDWGVRNNIIEGIARGLLYLHRDSRLKIIHRDLKASNILLDEHMIPRISDFGMARIVGIDKSIENTNRIVGTYGYMSPEYAMQGIVSVKSDVFSFGVLLLEIVSGKRNTDFYDSENPRNLLGYAWQLWNEENALELLDPNLVDSCNTKQVYRCIHVALLCVQEHVNDRPTMSDIVFMICHDTSLPIPKKPAFCWTGLPAESAQRFAHVRYVGSNNDITISSVNAR